MNTEQIKSHLPVKLIRGQDRLTADTLDYDNRDRVVHLNGRVKGLWCPPDHPKQLGESLCLNSFSLLARPVALGQALAWRFYQAGYTLALVARRVRSSNRGRMQQRINRQSLSNLQRRCRHHRQHHAAAGDACLVDQGVPDVVIANAGISIGMDTRHRSDLDVMARTFATNNVGWPLPFTPL